MAIRSILVHVNDDTNNDTTIRAAISLARQNEAVLTGLYVRPFPIVVPVAPIGGAMPVIDGMIEAYQQMAILPNRSAFTAVTLILLCSGRCRRTNQTEERQEIFLLSPP